MNQTLIAMLRNLPEKQTSRWKDSLNKVVHAYNRTRHEATGYSPFYLLYGRHSRLPVDILFGLSTNVSSSKNYQRYMQKWTSAMTSPYHLATKHSRPSRACGRKYHEPNVPAPVLQPGERVKGPGKLRSTWEQQIHKIVCQVKMLLSMKSHQKLESNASECFIEISCSLVICFHLTPCTKVISLQGSNKGWI